MSYNEIKTSKKGVIMHSSITGNVYRVFKWKEDQEGHVIALKKELVEEWEEP